MPCFTSFYLPHALESVWIRILCLSLIYLLFHTCFYWSLLQCYYSLCYSSSMLLAHREFPVLFCFQSFLCSLLSLLSIAVLHCLFLNFCLDIMVQSLMLLNISSNTDFLSLFSSIFSLTNTARGLNWRLYEKNDWGIKAVDPAMSLWAVFWKYSGSKTKQRVLRSTQMSSDCKE